MVDRSSQYSGSVYDDPVLITDAKYLESRVPYLGHRAELDEGRMFRYVSTSATFVACEVVATATSSAVGNVANTGYTAVAGVTELTLNTSATDYFGAGAGIVTANRFSEGFLHITDDAGQGYTYKIKSHPAYAAAADWVVTLYDPIKVALAATSLFTLTGPRWKNVIEGTAALPVLGTAMVPTVAASGEQGFWIQTRGPGSILVTTETGITIGEPLQMGAGGGVVLGASAAIRSGAGVGWSLQTAATAADCIGAILDFE